jgi:hypothetical protein
MTRHFLIHYQILHYHRILLNFHRYLPHYQNHFLVVEETKVGAQEVLEEVQDLVADQEVADHLVDLEEMGLVADLEVAGPATS